MLINGSFHCLFCHGYEERGAKSAGALVTDAATAGHMPVAARFARQLADGVTLYTNSNETITTQLKSAFLGKRISIDDRAIAKLEKSAIGSDVIVHFKDGSFKTEGFLVHAPQTKLNGPFAEQLGVELVSPSEIKVSPPFNETSVPGVFAAGDSGNMMKNVALATTQGMLAGAGLCMQLGTEKDE